MVSVYLYVEGGGDTRTSLDECRKGFRLFLENAGMRGKMPRIVACGSRWQAYEKFCQKVKEAERYGDCLPFTRPSAIWSVIQEMWAILP